MSTVNDLIQKTEEFLEMHWNKFSSGEKPTWSEPWKFQGEVHDNTYPGCYALVDDGKVVYVGLALNKGAAGYDGHALGTRIKKYWRVDKERTEEYGEKVYTQSSNVSGSYDSIYVLAFKDHQQAYLAASLELYLIKALQPEMNQRGK